MEKPHSSGVILTETHWGPESEPLDLTFRPRVGQEWIPNQELSLRIEAGNTATQE